MTITSRSAPAGATSSGYELATDAQFRELSNFSTPRALGGVTAIEASGQVRVETDDPDGGDVLAWPLSGLTYAVDDVVYIAFAVNSPDSAIVIGSLGNLPTIDPAMLPFVKVDGSTPLTGDWNIGEDRAILAELLKARDVEGLTLQDDGGNVAIVLLDGGGVVIGALSGSIAANGDITIQGTTNSTRTTSYVLLQPNGGNVGIGISAPTVLLHVKKDSDAAIRARMENADGGTSAQAGWDLSNGTDAFQMFLTGTGFTPSGLQLARMAYFNANAAGGLMFRTISAVDIVFGVNTSTEVMRILGSAKITMGGLASIGATLLGVKAGASSNDFAPGGTLYMTTSQTGNVGAGEDDLASYSVPADTLSANGMSLWFEAAGTSAANANAKTLRVRFGTSGTNLIISATVTGSGSGAKSIVRGRITRTGAATQKGYAELVGANIATTVDVATALNQTLSGAVTLKITGEATSNNDIVLESFRVEWDDQNT